MAAPTKTLSDLHAHLAKVMCSALDSEQDRIRATQKLLNSPLPELDDDQQQLLLDVLALAPTARVDNSLLKTIASFLKDNSITADLNDNDEDNETTTRLAELAAKRRKVALPTDTIN